MFSGATYFGYSNAAMQFDNLTAELIARGLQTPDAVDLVYDANSSVGGPVRRDKLWFFARTATSATTTSSPTASIPTGGRAFTISACRTARRG